MPCVPERLADQPKAPGDDEEEEEEEGAGKGVERVGRERRRGVLPASPLASLSLDTPFSGSPTPGGGPWFPFSPHRDTDKVTHPEKGQSVGRSVTRSPRNSSLPGVTRCNFYFYRTTDTVLNYQSIGVAPLHFLFLSLIYFLLLVSCATFFIIGDRGS